MPKRRLVRIRLTAPDEVFRPVSRRIWSQDSDVSQLHFVNHEACPKWAVDNPLREIRHFKRSGFHPFLLYEGGKSAIRCAHAAHADGPHRFATVRGTSRVSPAGEILHYGCYSYEAWLQKYLHLGDFSDWYLDDFRTPITKRFHLESRNIVLDCVSRGTFEPCEDFFRRVVWTDADLREGLLRRELLLRGELTPAGGSGDGE